jgi:hypothetical protein
MSNSPRFSSPSRALRRRIGAFAPPAVVGNPAEVKDELQVHPGMAFKRHNASDQGRG